MGIEQTYAERNTRSRELYERAGRVLPSGVTHDGRFQRPFPIAVTHAQGSQKWDVDGHELTDYVMGHGALLLGHAYPAVTEAVVAQAAKGTHYGANHELEVAWAEHIVRLVPSAEVVRFTSSGTEATLMALRLARAATGRPSILKFDRHFHGWHDYVVANSSYQAATPPGIPQTTLDSVAVAPVDMAAVREIIAGREDIGTVIIEASGAGSGLVPLPRGFLQELRHFTAERGLVMVMDEVVTGFRWSPGGVQQREGVVPDLTTLAKIMAGGLPGGAVAGRRDLLERLEFPAPGSKVEKVAHPGTFNANPLSSAAGVACLSEMGDGAHQARADAMAARLRTGINEVFTRCGIGGVAYGQASEFKVMTGIDFAPGARDWDPRDLPASVVAAPAKGDTARLLTLALINRGVHAWGGPSGFVSSVHSEATIDRTIEAFEGAIVEVMDEVS